jgi:pilus assembly protein CpaB
MGKYKSFILLGAAVIVALITSMLIYTSLQKKNQNAAAPLPTQPVAVAVTDMAWGTALTKEMVKTVPYLKEHLPEGCSSDPASLVGRVLVYPVKANEPIFESRLAPTNIKTGGVAAVISPKKRAVAVKVDQVIGVSGFIHAGNRVDVLVTISPDKASSNPVTKIVLENVLVLAAGPEVERKGKDPTPVNVITLEVAPDEAQKLALAATEGKLQLALRNFNDTEDVQTKGTTIPILLASFSSGKDANHSGNNSAARRKGVAKPKPAPEKPAVILAEKKVENAPPAPKEKPPEKKSIYIVEVIKAGKISEVKFEREDGSR